MVDVSSMSSSILYAFTWGYTRSPKHLKFHMLNSWTTDSLIKLWVRESMQISLNRLINTKTNYTPLGKSVHINATKQVNALSFQMDCRYLHPAPAPSNNACVAIVDLIENFPQGLDLGLRENRDIWGIWSAELKSKRVG